MQSMYLNSSLVQLCVYTLYTIHSMRNDEQVTGMSTNCVLVGYIDSNRSFNYPNILFLVEERTLPNIT